MPVQEFPLPVGAKNIHPPIPTITRSSKDGNIPVVQLFIGDNFVGDVLEGHWVKGVDSTWTNPFTAKIASGKLDLAGAHSSGTKYGWMYSQAPFPVRQNSYIDVHLEVETVTPSLAFAVHFYLRGQKSTDLPFGNGDSIDMRLMRSGSTTYISGTKTINGSGTSIYSNAAITNDEGTFRFKFRPDDGKIDIYFHDGAGDVDESSDELTLLDDDWDLPFEIGYPALMYMMSNSTIYTVSSEEISVYQPDLSIGYDQDATDIGKGDVKVYDTMGSVTETDWRRVHDESHDFTGDCVIENGLIRLIVDEAQQYGLELYYWTGSVWSQPFDVLRFETDPTTYNLDYPFLKDIVSINRNESVQLRVRMCNSATESDTIYGEFLVTLERGKYHIGFLGETLTPRLDTIVLFYEDGTPFRFAYIGESEVADADVTQGDSASSTTLTDNFMMIFDDAGDAVIGFIATDKKPDGENKEFEALEISTDMAISVHSIAPDDFATTTTYVGIAPYPDNDHLFTESEDGTTNGTDDVSDGSASGGFKVVLDAQDEYVYVTLTGVTDLPEGRYKMVVRASDANQIADDLELYVYNQTDSRFMNEDRAESKLTSNAATWDFYSIVFEVVAADDGDTIRLYVNKGTATANTINVDYFLIVPISNGESMPQDMAHNVMREASVNFRLTDSATFQLFSGLGIAAQLAGSVYTDAMAINAIESAASIDLTGSFSASTIKTSADNEGIYVGAGDDLRLFHDGNDSYVQNSQGQLILKCIGDDVVIDAVDSFIDISGEFYIRDKGDANVILAELDTIARTLQFGQAADKLTTDIYGDLTISDYLTIDTINHETTDVDKFLVSNTGVVKYRTGSELLIDIGAVGVPLALTDLASYVQGSIIMGGGADWEPLVAGTETYVLTMGADEPYWASSAGGHDENHVLATSGPHTSALPLADIASYVQGSIIIGGGADWEPLVAGTLNYVLKMGADEPAWGQVDYSELTGSQPAPIAHVLDSASHTISGKTPGHFLKALTATTYGFAAHGLEASDVGAAPEFTKTQWTLPVFDTTTTIGDSMLSQDAGGTILTVGGSKIVLTPVMQTSHDGITVAHTSASISAGQTFRSYYADGSNLVTGGGSTNFYGFHVDYSGVTLTNNPNVIGFRADLPATYGGVAAIEAAGYFTGDGRILQILTDDYAIDIDSGLKIVDDDIFDSSEAQIIGTDGAGYIDYLANQGDPDDNDVLAWDESSGKWIVQPQTGGTGQITGSGTQWTIPVFDTTTSLADSMFSQDSAGNNASIGGTLTLSNIVNTAADRDRFLVSNSGEIQYRSGAGVLADIEGAPLSYSGETFISAADMRCTGTNYVWSDTWGWYSGGSSVNLWQARCSLRMDTLGSDGSSRVVINTISLYMYTGSNAGRYQCSIYKANAPGAPALLARFCCATPPAIGGSGWLTRTLSTSTDDGSYPMPVTLDADDVLHFSIAFLSTSTSTIRAFLGIKITYTMYQ